ncbi:MAG TPA: alpha/beta hydrolase [Polyangia bacterium]|nr:alpha/beta hydrolase [Polyangia bacterium]
MKTVVSRSLVRRALAIVALGIALSCGAQPATAAPEESPGALTAGRHAKPSILLVHGAFAGALAWQKVTTLLQQRGYTVVAVENPLTSLDTDVATTKRAIAALATKGPLVVVGHSYGGMVITGAAADTPQVKALVYINAFAPQIGQSAGALLASGPAVKLSTALLPPDSAGFLFVDTTLFRGAFFADVPVDEANVAAASQKPIAGSAFGATLNVAAWKTIPSWYLVGRQDEAIPPVVERAMARAIGAHTLEIDSSHVPFISHPEVVAHLIEEAARSVH